MSNWTPWFWAGAGVIGAGKVPIGYVAQWPETNTQQQSIAWANVVAAQQVIWA